MAWSVGEPSLVGRWDIGPVVYSASFDNAPAVTPPADTELFFANGGAGLAKNNAQLVALLATATATDVEDGSLAVTADLSALADPIPAGVYTIPLSATDSDGLTGNASFQLTVTEAAAVNDPPVSSGNYAQQSAIVGVPFSFDGSQNVSDPGDTLTYEISGVSWMTINSSTGMITGTPTAAGGYTATITATDSVGQSVSVLLPVVVSAQTVGTYLVLVSASILPDNTHYVRNDLVFRCEIQDEDGAAITSGTVSLSIKETNGSETQGIVWPLSLSHQGSGAWECVIDAALASEHGKTYVWELTAESGQLDGFWKKSYQAKHRAF